MNNVIVHSNKKKTTKEFIEAAKKIWGDKYDFSKVDYQSANKKVCIICPEHGEFFVKPSDFLHHHGCAACAGLKKMSTQEFIEKAQKINGNRYDYSLVNYKNSVTPIEIICHKKDDNGIEHGVFKQAPKNHLRGNGCPKCYKSSKKTTEEFIEQAKQIHGEKYDYSKVHYKGNKIPITIICPKHGEFSQTPLYHLQGHGCIHCYNERRGEATRIGNENFIKKAKEIHGEKYDYNNVKYVNSKTKVSIICPKHGEFLMTPSKHLNSKQGCPVCSESHLEKNVALFLEQNNIKYERQKRFNWLKHKGYLSLDFYLPDYNIAIECQGEQHYRDFIFFGNKSSLESIKERDEIKYKLCTENGIKILYLSHSMAILNVSNIYTKGNTFTSMEILIKNIKNTTLFEQIVNEININ